MKNLLVLATLVLGAAAQAEVKRPGTLVPVRCTIAETSRNPESVCLMKQVGTHKQFIEFNTAGPTDAMITVRAEVTEERPGLGHEWLSTKSLSGRAKVDPADAITYREYNNREFKLLIQTHGNRLERPGSTTTTVSFLIDGQVVIGQTPFEVMFTTMGR